MSVLRKILAHKRKEVASSKRKMPIELMKKKALSLPRRGRSFARALRNSGAIGVIAEIKRRSPSKGLLSRNFDAPRIAKQYQKAGACALSVLTDRKYFGGSPALIARVKKASRLPVLRKDFIVDEYQVYESKLLGADAILLIACALKRGQMSLFYKTATRLGMDTLFEVHDRSDLRKVRPLKPRLVGVNNRDLRTFRTSLDVSRRLAREIPRRALFVSESGIASARDLRTLRSLGVRAALVGESLMREKDPGRALKRLLGGSHHGR